MDRTYTSHTENSNGDFHGRKSITFGNEGMTSTSGQNKYLLSKSSSCREAFETKTHDCMVTVHTAGVTNVGHNNRLGLVCLQMLPCCLCVMSTLYVWMKIGQKKITRGTLVHKRLMTCMQTCSVCMLCLCVICMHTPRLGSVLHCLQPRFHQIQRLEEQCRTSAA